MHANADSRHRVIEGAADTLASMAHLPAKVAMAAGSFILGGAGLHREADAGEPKALYHEDSAHMREADHSVAAHGGTGRAPRAATAAGDAHAEPPVEAEEGLAFPGVTQTGNAGQQGQHQTHLREAAGDSGSETAEQQSRQPETSTRPESAAPSVSTEVQPRTDLTYFACQQAMVVL